MATIRTHATAAQLGTSPSDIQRLPTVCQRMGLGSSTIYRLMAQQSFPSAVQLSTRAVGWPKSTIDAWLEARPRQLT
ncbi:helix-turn-helix transcriptional regulator [Roseateles cellulosilyticus]|uniref:AlpA family phage regulatory protein n=1 Tax=Pelomonas cellulosilytica TaxID=2906762 RepID=A0ABS8Y404_9BURK|nr:AlpA family phage regulatory protein [Pelomonas sp. P8]MCE4558012.1 AlpA family phage regulatory protein [Pelomonas sp. P8]